MNTPHWWEDHDELIGFANWYWDGTANTSGQEILYFFEKPWKWNTEYQGYKEDTK